MVFFILLMASYFYLHSSTEEKVSTPQKSKKTTSAINETNKVSILDKYSYSPIKGKPKKRWVGKLLKIEFDMVGGWSIRGKTKIVELLGYGKDDEGYKYFDVKDLSDGYLEQVFFFWFGNDNHKNDIGPNIKSWKEAIPKKSN